ncbi:MAG: hypothetical protein AAFQ75_03140 [Pseudomonadota bacterium]
MYSSIERCPVGYCFAEDASAFAFKPPRLVIEGRQRPAGARAIQNCPAVNNLERQLIELPSPINLRLKLRLRGPGQVELKVKEKGSFAEPHRLERMLSLAPPATWPHPQRPLVQLRLPYFFVTDEASMASLLPPFFSASMRRWPGLMQAERWPLAIWPQDLVWTLEWQDPEAALQLRQGEPIAFLHLEFNRPEKRPELTEAALTPALAEYRAGMDQVEAITDRIEEIWDAAGTRRPARLLTPLDETANA